MNVPVILLAAGLLAACSGSPARRSSARDASTRSEAPAAKRPAAYTYRIEGTYPHATSSYTQGLLYHDGVLWEGTGQYGHSALQRVDLETGRTEPVARLPRSEFGEGIALLDTLVFQLTWQSNKAYVYDARTGRKVREHRYAGEGWGLTTDGERLYMSDGKARIRILDPATFRRTGSLTVTYEGEAVGLLNELEWIDGKIWANVYTSDRIVVIDPATGRVEGVVDLTGLLPEADRGPQTDVLNGIAYDADGGRIFVTGKNWPKLFHIEILPQ